MASRRRNGAHSRDVSAAMTRGDGNVRRVRARRGQSRRGGGGVRPPHPGRARAQPKRRPADAPWPPPMPLTLLPAAGGPRARGSTTRRPRPVQRGRREQPSGHADGAARPLRRAHRHHRQPPREETGRRGNCPCRGDPTGAALGAAAAADAASRPPRMPTGRSIPLATAAVHRHGGSEQARKVGSPR